MSQLQLLRERSYWPLFWTQFFGVFSQCAFLTALLFAAIPSAQFLGLSGLRLGALGALVYSMSATLSALALPSLVKSIPPVSLFRRAKLLQTVMLLLAAFGAWTGQPWLWMIALISLGVQVSVLSSAKFAVLPALIGKDELLSANALLAAGSFVATLCGISFGTIGLWGASGIEVVALGAAVGATLAALFGLAIQPGEVSSTSTKDVISEMAPGLAGWWHNRPLYLTSLGVGWFWFFVTTVALTIARYADVSVSGDPRVAVVCAAVFCLGVAAGAFVCERLSLARLELGVVPLGSVGMTLFLIDLSLANDPWPWLAGGFGDLLAQLLSDSLLRIALDLGFLGLFTGIFLVPLRTLLQERSPRGQRMDVMAGTQAMCAGLASLSLFLFGVLPTYSWAQFPLWSLLLLNALVTVYIYRLIPEFLLRFVLWCVSRVMYRVRIHGEEFLPSKGACVLVCNHVSFVDWMLVAAACPRPVRFVMYHRYLHLPLLGFLLRDAHVIPIAPAHEDAGLLDAAFDRIAQELAAGEIVCIFPEGKLTTDGKLNRFRTGIERVVERTPVPVVPMALDGMWGSYFSKKDGEHFQRPFRRLWSKVQLIVGPPMAPADVTAAKLERMVAGLGGFQPPSERK
jgi:1-acyl-sn-glycerol-3-phosphate acyltransferase